MFSYITINLLNRRSFLLRMMDITLWISSSNRAPTISTRSFHGSLVLLSLMISRIQLLETCKWSLLSTITMNSSSRSLMSTIKDSHFLTRSHSLTQRWLKILPRKLCSITQSESQVIISTWRSGVRILVKYSSTLQTILSSSRINISKSLQICKKVLSSDLEREELPSSLTLENTAFGQLVPLVSTMVYLVNKSTALTQCTCVEMLQAKISMLSSFVMLMAWKLTTLKTRSSPTKWLVETLTSSSSSETKIPKNPSSCITTTLMAGLSILSGHKVNSFFSSS